VRIGLRAALLLALLAAFPLHAEILVALAWDLHGAGATPGVELAIEQINRSGGLLGQTLRLVEFDDGCQEKQTMIVARLVAERHPALVVGHGCSASTIAAAPVYDAAGAVLIAPAATHTKLTEMGLGSVFRLTGRDDRQAKVAANLIARRWPRSRIAVLNDQSVYGLGLTDSVRTELAARHIPIALDGTFQSRVAAHAELIARLRDAKIDLVYVAAAWVQDIGTLLHELQDAALPVTLLSGDTANNVGSWLNGDVQSTPLLFTFLDDPLQKAAAAPLLARAKDRGITLNRVSVQAYAGIEAWAQSVRQAGTTDGRAVSRILHRRKFDTVMGEIAFDSKGDLQPPASEWVWYQWRGSNRDRLDGN
jgi:branched-chain amino acid transport system substrate-binding protein